jgi:hypothetical protein
MATIFRKDVRFDEVAGAALEQEYEDLVAGNANQLFPEFAFVPFKISVSDGSRLRKADYALVDREYRTWWVVEIELAHHPFNGHVLPQIEVLSRAMYGEREAEYLKQQEPALDLARLKVMMLGAQPQVLVIVNEPCPHWEPELRIFDARLLSIALFRSDANDYVFLVNGEVPRVRADVLTRCRREPLLRRFWEVESPGALPMPANEPFSVRFAGRTATWRRIDSKDAVYLAPEGASDALGAWTTVVDLVIIEGDRLEFRSPT